MRWVMHSPITAGSVAVTKTNDTVSSAAKRLTGKKRGCESFSVLLTLLLLTVAQSTRAATIVIDPGAVGSVSTGWDSFFTGLNGTVFNGQSQSLDVYFSDSKFAVTPSLGVNLDINESGAI